MVRAENLAVGTRDKIELGPLDDTDFLVRLYGELDVRERRALRETLDLVLSTGLTTVVDLSGVTFLDARCARELAVRSGFYDHLVLCDPSLQARASFEVCGREVEIFAHPCSGYSCEEPSRVEEERAG